MKSWESLDEVGAIAASRKLDLHLDYLTGKNVVFAFASDMVEDSEKAKMAETLVETTKVNISLGKPRTLSVYNDSALHHFIDEESWLFFNVCGLEPTFLTRPPSEWSQDSSYVRFKHLVRGFTPLNDAGERAVKLGSDFHGSLAKDSLQHQAVLQNVEAHRQNYPIATKNVTRHCNWRN